MPLQLIRSDITQMKVDAIVNAANSSLLGGGGVDGAIHRAAGPKLLEECRTLGGCRTGEAKLSRGYDLPCEYVIHTVGPVWGGGGHGEREQLASCYRSSLELACEMDFRTVAFPLISTGAYGYPKQEAMHVAIDTITQFLLTHDMTVFLVLFTGDAFRIGGRLFHSIASYIDDVYVAEHDDDDDFKRMRRLEAARQKRLTDAAFGRNSLWDAAVSSAPPKGAAPSAELEDLLQQMDAGFAETLLRWIDEKGMTDAECYKRANIDRRLFNKLKNNPDYRPSKPTALAFAIALRLNLAQTKDLLSRAGYALTRSSKSDIVVEYCIQHHEYDIFEINAVLFDLDLQPLGG